MWNHGFLIINWLFLSGKFNIILGSIIVQIIYVYDIVHYNSLERPIADLSYYRVLFCIFSVADVLLPRRYLWLLNSD